MTKGRLLVIDDEPDLRDVLVTLLENEASEIVLAANGAEAISQLESQSFEAILSDERMPKKSGLDVLRWLRHRGRDTPFVIHTGYGSRQLYAEAEALNAFGIIEKPWTEETLVTTVRKALELGVALKKAVPVRS